ncbi:hypothetical protein GCM10025869_08590 [Homoserinibacter gongjuensis]|uniref:Uncharacterized protein n=1 Tax=Homoserinibacter gongjuensis TaxID=1162968 RepID=A0ABQ6JPV7_9MICO|nr:hypothetical protein GCM10025869_08590 [Homoserinibacter gongjuensis]
MIHPQPLREAFVDPAQDLAVGGGEHLGQLDPHGRELVDAEEASVGELGVGARPVHEFVVLTVVHDLDGGAVVAGAGGERIAVFVIVQLIALDAERAGRRRIRHRFAEHRDAHAPAARGPVDVEEARVRGVLAEAQHIPPPAVGGGIADAHVVGHDVDEHPHPAGAGGAREPLEPVGAAAARIDARVVDHVIAVRGARGRGQQRREVEPVGPQRAQIVGQLGRGGERELGGQLDAVRRAGSGFMPPPGRRRRAGELPPPS